MENKIIVGNIKMNMKFGEIPNYLRYFENIDYKDLIICPSYIYIPYFLNYKFKVGSQNVCKEETGTYTGEVSAKQLCSIGVKYTIIGHSERRIKLNETDTDINNKIKSALKANLNVILCIGETKEQSELLKTDVVLKRQLKNALEGIEDVSNIIVAYEPVWAVGTSILPSLTDLNSTIRYIKGVVSKINNQDVKVIYGGSINEKNILDLKKLDNLDGFLIGSASINPTQFIDIINKVVGTDKNL